MTDSRSSVHPLLTDTVLSQLSDLCQRAGEGILSIYHQAGDIVVEHKDDHSPLTQADKLSHHILVEGLRQIAPDVPILSEEGKLPSFDERRQWCDYWLVDPLDGTKEFVSRNGEFTVNVALVSEGTPIMGVVHSPVLACTYAGGRSLGATKIIKGEVCAIHTRALVNEGTRRSSIAVVASRRHGVEALAAIELALASCYPTVYNKAMGSSLKFCLIAEGQADLYIRMAPTSEWDTAAAQAILEAAGGAVLNPLFMPLRYNQQESVLNPHFVAVGDLNENWRKIISLQ